MAPLSLALIETVERRQWRVGLRVGRRTSIDRGRPAGYVKGTRMYRLKQSETEALTSSMSWIIST
jgi:hypothetical protein